MQHVCLVACLGDARCMRDGGGVRCTRSERRRGAIAPIKCIPPRQRAGAGPHGIGQAHLEVPDGQGHQPDGAGVADHDGGRGQGFGEAVGVSQGQGAEHFGHHAGGKHQPGESLGIHDEVPLPTLRLYRARS